MKHVIVTAVLAMSAFTRGWAEPCSFPVTGLQMSSAALVSLEVPVSALADLGGRLDALRLYDGQRRETPFLSMPVAVPGQLRQREDCPSKVLQVRETPDAGVLVDFELVANAPAPTGLTIDTPLRRFEQRVTLSAEVDGSWQTLVPDALIFESSGILAMRHNEVQFPLSAARRFRLSIGKVSIERQAELRQVTRVINADGVVSSVESTVLRDEAFKIGAVQFWREKIVKVDGETKMLSYPAKDLQREGLAETKQSVYLFTPDCYPVTGLDVVSLERNYQRTVQVQCERGTVWQDWYRGTVSAIRLPGFEKVNTVVNFSGIGEGRIRLIIDEHDNPPLELTEIRLRTPAMQLLFFAEPQRVPYQLTALQGGEAPEYQQHAIIQDAWASRAAVQPAGLGERQGTPMELTTTMGMIIPRWVLFVALLLAAAALALGVFKAAQSAKVLEQSK